MRDWGGPGWFGADVVLDAPAITMCLARAARPLRRSQHTMKYHAHLLYVMDDTCDV